MRLLGSVIPIGVGCCCVLGCQAARGPVVEQYGRVREVLGEGKTEARVALRALTGRPNAYAVGALAGLAGEVTIVAGDVWVSRVVDDSVQVAGPDAGDSSATLLSLAYVDTWRTHRLPDVIREGELDSVIATVLRDLEVDRDTAVPFLIDGVFSNLHMHVVRGSCPHRAAASGVDGAPPWRYESNGEVCARLIGFHAQDAEGVMTHHGQQTHIHAVFEHNGARMAGHVDRVRVEPGAVLRLPD